jgi:hypothetical protein
LPIYSELTGVGTAAHAGHTHTVKNIGAEAGLRALQPALNLFTGDMNVVRISNDFLPRERCTQFLETLEQKII